MSDNKNHFDDLNNIENELPEEVETVEIDEEVLVEENEQLSLFNDEEVKEQLLEKHIPEAEEIDFLKESKPFYPQVEIKPEEPKQNNFLKIIGVSLLAACFGLVGGFIGSNLDVSNPSEISIKNYKVDPVIISTISDTLFKSSTIS